MRPQALKSLSCILGCTFLAITLIFGVSNAQKRGQKTFEVADQPAKAVETDIPGPRFFQWQTVANNGYTIPGTGNTKFSSYGQPSVNFDGSVVFRARSTGGQRATGIYYRTSLNSPIITIADLQTEVPYPNNLNSKFREFSAFPRIAPNSLLMATLGLHQPVYRFILPDGTETRSGTNGIYVKFGNDQLVTGASKLGNVPDFEFYGVPGFKQLVFDVFPGAPAITDDGDIVFKANYTVDGIGKTGIFFRRLANSQAGGYTNTEMIANSDTEIPGLPPSAFAPPVFGSTAPPSAFGDRVVFLGLDVEEDPHAGGIYHAFIKSNATLEPVVEIGQTVDGLKMPPLTRIGEALAFDGRFVYFWAAWGDEWNTIRLNCPVDGNADIRNYCNGVDPKSIYDPNTDSWYQYGRVPVNQGIFVYDLWTRTGYLAADNSGYIKDFVYWTYSGHVPAPDEPDAEPPRWRSTAFVAGDNGWVVFKGRISELTGNKEYINPIDGLYMANPMAGDPLKTIIETGMDGALIDPGIPEAYRGTLPILGFGLEREAFRGNMLAITATMGNEEFSWGGIYLTNVGPNRTGGPIDTVRDHK